MLHCNKGWWASMVLAWAVGCAPPVEEAAVEGPPAVERWAIDAIALPEKASEFADDLDGDGRLDNRLGALLGILRAHQTDGAASLPAMLSSCATAPAIEVIEARATRTGWRVNEGASMALLDGERSGRRFVSSRARHAARAVEGAVRLPVFADADPLVLRVVGLEVEWSDEAGVLRGALHGAVRVDALLLETAYRAALEMLARRPEDHVDLRRALDGNHDGDVTREEFARAPIVEALLAPDVQLFAAGRWSPTPNGAAKDSISIGFGFTARRDHRCTLP